MANYVQLPNGAYYEAKEGQTYEQAIREAYAKYPEAFGRAAITAPEEAPRGGFTPAFRAGIESLKGEAALTAGKLGLMGAKEAEEYRAKREERAKQIFKPTEEGWTEAPVQKTLELLGGSLPYMAAPIAAGAAAIPLGAAAPVVGALGAGAASLAQFTGTNLARQIEEAQARGEDASLEKASLGKAAAAAVPQAALDVFSLRGIPLIRNLFKSVGKDLTEAEAKAITQQGMRQAVADYALTTGKVAGREGLTEVGQQYLERLQAGLAVTDPAARAEYVESLIGGAVLGGVISPAGRAIERGGEKRKAEKFLADQEKAAALQQEQEAEAAASQPSALLKLDADYTAALARKKELEDAKSVKLTKDSTEEEREAKKQAKENLNTFMQEEFIPLRREYEKRKDAIAEVKKAQAPAEVAPPAPAPAAPEEEQVSPDVQRLMVEQDALTKQLQDIQTQIASAAEAGSTDQFRALNEQRQKLQRSIDARAALIEEKGGVAVPAVEFEQQTAAKMSALDAQMAKLQEDFARAAKAQEFDKAADISAKLDDIRTQRDAFTADTAKRMQALQEKQAGMEQRGQTQELFGEMPAQPEEQRPLEFRTFAGKPIETLATKPEEALSLEVKPAEAPAGPTKVQQAEEALRTAAAGKTDTATLQTLNQRLQEARAEESRAGTPPEAEQRAKALKAATESGRSPARIAELQQELQDVVPTTDKTLDLFSNVNVLRTGIQNNDPVAIQKALQGIERREQAKATETREKQQDERVRLAKALEDRLGLSGEKVTRTATPEQYDSVMAQIETLRNKVEKPQKNAKRSILQELEDLAAEHALISNALETGMAYKVTMGDKVAQLNATLGKGEAAPAQRPMTAQERGAATKRLQGIATRYNMLADTKVAPIRQQIDALYSSLYERKEVKAPAVERAEKAAELQAPSGPQPMSRAAATAARIARGDVRKEAEASPEMRDLAVTLGRNEEEYKQFARGIKNRFDALKAKYGADDARVIEFQDAAKLQTLAKATEIGKKTPEYKAALKEQTEVMREALKETKFSKQTVPTKRTPQVTRKVSQARKETLTGSPESRAETAEEFKRLQESRQRGRDDFDDDTSTAYRKREDTSDAVVGAKEAEELIVNVKKELPSNVKFIYAATARDVPVRLLNQMAKEKANPADVQGAVFSDGTVLIIGENHANLKDLEATIAHELVGHYGIDTIIGLDRLQAYADKTDLGKLAEEIGGKNLLNEVAGVANTLADMGKSESIQKLQVLREIIAHTEEARVTEAFRNKAGRWIKELVGMVRAGLRRMGFMETAKLSTSDIFYMLRESRKAFADKKIGAYRSADGQTSFRQRREDVTTARSFVAEKPSLRDTLLGNLMGLSGRVQYVDQFAALSEAYKRGLSKGQITALEAQNAEFSLRFGQQVSQYAAQFLTNGAVERVGNKVPGGMEYIYRSKPGASLMGVAEELKEAGIKNDTEAEAMFTAYVAGLRAAVKGWDKLNLKDPALAKKEHADVMARLNADPKMKAAFEKANKLYQEFNNGLIDFLVQTGEMTAAKAAELKSLPYIPYYRVDGDVLNLYVEKERPIRIGNVKDQPELQQLKGGSQQIMPIFTSAVQNAYIITRMGLRNQMMKDAAITLRKMGIVSAMGEGQGPAGSSTVRFKIKGKDHFAVIDQDQFGIPAELIVKGMEGIKTAMPMVVEMMGYPADVLRKFVTRAPVYAVRQIIRDPLNVWMTNGTSTVPVLDAMRELSKMVTGRSEAEAKLMSAGAISSNVFSGDQRDMEMFMRDITAGKSFWDKTMAKADAFAMQGDAATRAVVYNDSLVKGMTEQQALLRTLESMNFSRRGLSPSMRWLSVMIPFFNAQIQGLDVLYRALKGDMPYNDQLEIRKKLVMRGLLMAGGTLGYAAVMQDDEAYKRAKPEERLANWFVYLPGVEEPVRVPIPFELGYLFKALPEALFNKMASDDKGKDLTSGMGKLLMQSNPFSLPQAVKPLTEVVLGKSFFAGDIESAREQRMLPTERYRETTTEIAKLIGSVTGDAGLTPIKVDYLIRGYTGGLGIALVQLANPLLAAKADNVQEPSTKPSKLPFIGGLFQPVEGRATLDGAYERMKEIEQAKGSFTKLIEDGRMADAKLFAQEYSTQLAFVETSGGLQKQLGELAKMRRQVRAAPNMSTERKDALLERIDQAEQRLAAPFIALYDRYQK